MNVYIKDFFGLINEFMLKKKKREIYCFVS